MNKYIYLFIRQDLNRSQQIIQAAHVVDALQYNREKHVANIVLFGVDNVIELNSIKNYLDQSNLDNFMFFEPDIGEHTAIATIPVSGAARKNFKKFKLYKPS